jgi:thioredoxin reductase (NADPH)
MARKLDRPLIVSFDGDPEAAQALHRALARYGLDYDVRTETSASATLALLRELHAEGAEVALVIVAWSQFEAASIKVVTEARSLHPTARRLLLRDWYSPTPAVEWVRESTLSGALDRCINTPWDPPEIGLHPAVTELLAGWARANRPRLEVVHVVGEAGCRRSHELRDLLERNGVPYRYSAPDSAAGQRIVARTTPDAELPAVAFLDGRVLADPTNAEVARALGLRTKPREAQYDVAIVGAGPAGLAAAVAASSEGLSTVVIEREAVGGQAGSTTTIRNYLGFPWGISGEELATHSFRQAAIFGTEFVFMQTVTSLRADGADRVLALADGGELRARAVLVASGVTYRRLGSPALESLVGVFYGTARSEAAGLRGKDAVVVGGGNSAGQAALHLARYARRVTLVSRRDSLRQTMSAYLIRELRARPNVEIRVGSSVTDGRGTERLEAVTVRDHGGRAEELRADALFLLIGAEPHTSWLPSELARDERGFLVTGSDLRADWMLDRDPLPFETSIPGVFAAGDVRHGSVQRVAAAAGGGAIAVNSVHAYLEETAQAPARPAAVRALRS